MCVFNSRRLTELQQIVNNLSVSSPLSHSNNRPTLLSVRCFVSGRSRPAKTTERLVKTSNETGPTWSEHGSRLGQRCRSLGQFPMSRTQEISETRHCHNSFVFLSRTTN